MAKRHNNVHIGDRTLFSPGKEGQHAFMTHIWKYRLILPAFVASIFLSAFLLFAVQPLFAKMVLPQLGGAPAVWSVAMVFFQTVLLLGYLYAHIIIRYVPSAMAALIHVIVTASAFLFLPIALYAGLGTAPTEGQIPWLLALFSISIGVPFFALSANGPLLQAWFARSGHPQAHDPYFLYAASNVGSLLALLLYPVIFEPNLALAMQSRAWTLGYAVLFTCLLFLSIMLQLAARRRSDEEAVGPDIAPNAMQRLKWTGLSFAASGLLIAVTAHISTDVAAVPFLWVAPLALYLLTFIIAFSRKPLFTSSAIIAILPFVVAPLLMLLISGFYLPWHLSLVLHMGGFFLLTLLCHLTLAQSRPPAARLTEFYFFLSLGGVLGGVFAGLAAPYIFKNVTEYPLLIVASLFALPGLFEAYKTSGKRDLAFVAVTLMLATGAALVMRKFYTEGIMWVTVLVIVGTVLIADRKKPLRFLLLSAGALFFLSHLRMTPANLSVERSFFGVHRAYDTDDGLFHIIQHGTTIHGAQIKDEARSKTPITYYSEDGNFGQVLAAYRAKHKIGKIGVIGLGSGTMSCHVKPGEKIEFFEIDPVVVSLAKTEFSFIRQCAPDANIVLGDARLTLASIPDASYDILFADAFTSDVVPVHLLTKQAIELYFSKIKPGGLVFLHISNRNLEMENVLATAADELGVVALTRLEQPDDERYKQMVTSSHVFVMARKAEDFGILAKSPGWRVPDGHGVAAWTDDYSNIFGAMMRRIATPRGEK